MDSSQPAFADLLEVQTAARRSVELTRQLLAFARRQTIQPKVMDLREAVTGMLKMLRRLIGEQISLTLETSGDAWSVKLDPSQVDQILVNLCVNARDSIRDVGRVSIEIANRVLEQDDCAQHPDHCVGDYVQLSVSDNGRGMCKETLSRLFEPFFTTKELGKGTGLGLAIVYGIVKQNGGFISVVSELERGTTFKIYLPRYTGSPLPQVECTVRAIEGGRETILLVEDEPSILSMTKKMLERHGYSVLAAPTPIDAIRIATEYRRPIDLLVTDVIMPEMNGRDLAARLVSPFPAIKCLFMSGYTADVIAHHGVLEEGVHFIQKPFAEEGLAKKVREALADSH